MTTTTLTLNDHQQEVVDRLKALPGARRVTIETNIYVNTENNTTNSSMEIHGGADGPEPIGCPTCGHRQGQANISVTFVWTNNSFYKARIRVSPGARLRPPRRRLGLQRALSFVDRFVTEEFHPTLEGLT